MLKLKFPILIRHRLFFSKISQNPDYVSNFCTDLNSPFHFAYRKWMFEKSS